MTIINCFDTYQQRVDLLACFFQEKGYSVTQVRSDFSHRTKRILPDEQKQNGVFYLEAKPYQKNISVARLRSHHYFAAGCAAFLESLPQPDLLWVLLPPNSLAKACAQYKHTHPNVKLVFDLIDLWVE